MNVDKAQVDGISKADLLPFFHEKLGMDSFQARQVLWDTYEPYSLWYLFGAIGLGSLCALFLYNHVISASEKNPGHSFNTRGSFWVKAFLIPLSVILVITTILHFSVGLLLNTLFFCMMLVFALTPQKPALSNN